MEKNNFVPKGITEKLIDLGLAKDMECLSHYWDEDENIFSVREQDNIEKGWIPAYTYSQVFRWMYLNFPSAKEEFDSIVLSDLLGEAEIANNILNILYEKIK